MYISIFYHHVNEAAKRNGISIEDEMLRFRKIGIEGIEFDREEIGHTEEAILQTKALLERCGLKASCVCGYYKWESQDPSIQAENKQLEDIHIRQAKILGVQQIMLIPGFFTAEDLGDEAAKQKKVSLMVPEMKKMVAKALDAGVRCNIEDYDSVLSPISTWQGMNAFAEAIPDLTITLDTGNLYFSGQDILAAEELFRHRIGHVHLKDRYVLTEEEAAALSEEERRAMGDETLSPLVPGKRMYPAPVGYGALPLKECLKRVKALKYDGPMIIEAFGAADYEKLACPSVEWIQENWE